MPALRGPAGRQAAALCGRRSRPGRAARAPPIPRQTGGRLTSQRRSAPNPTPPTRTWIPLGPRSSSGRESGRAAPRARTARGCCYPKPTPPLQHPTPGSAASRRRRRPNGSCPPPGPADQPPWARASRARPERHRAQTGRGVRRRRSAPRPPPLPQPVSASAGRRGSRRAWAPGQPSGLPPWARRRGVPPAPWRVPGRVVAEGEGARAGLCCWTQRQKRGDDPRRVLRSQQQRQWCAGGQRRHP
mmetsp:Transcript_2203/g.5200  ORF Transcript_2203/g.5200 Transcript_2203/m.5200 type:complete len:244 (-) Transcript_2203:301-1032(-)